MTSYREGLIENLRASGLSPQSIRRLLHLDEAPPMSDEEIDSGAFPSTEPRVIRRALAKRAQALAAERKISIREATLLADKELRKAGLS